MRGDDEANEVLRTVIEKNPGTPVIAIQPGRVNGTVFRKPHRSYSAKMPLVLTTDSAPTGEGPAPGIARGLHARLTAPGFAEKIQKGYITGDARTVRGNQVDSTLSVGSYGPDKPYAKDVIVVVLSPEM